MSREHKKINDKLYEIKFSNSDNISRVIKEPTQININMSKVELRRNNKKYERTFSRYTESLEFELSSNTNPKSITGEGEINGELRIIRGASSHSYLKPLNIQLYQKKLPKITSLNKQPGKQLTGTWHHFDSDGEESVCASIAISESLFQDIWDTLKMPGLFTVEISIYADVFQFERSPIFDDNAPYIFFLEANTHSIVCLKAFNISQHANIKNQPASLIEKNKETLDEREDEHNLIAPKEEDIDKKLLSEIVTNNALLLYISKKLNLIIILGLIIIAVVISRFI
jgi:hypothetical protein